MDDDGNIEYTKAGFGASPWKPSIHMPRWASRITLGLTEVRVQRLQEISEEDAKAEGVWGDEPYQGVGDLPSDRFAALWDSINEKRGFGWNTDPFVWCLSFKRVAQAALDAVGGEG